MHPGNHTSVWGSYWRDGEWGYACCHQFVKNSYCTGMASERAAEQSLAAQERNLEAKAAAAPPTTDASNPQVRANVQIREHLSWALQLLQALAHC